MENASHALIMAGGIVIAMAVLGLLLFAFHKYQNYRQSESDSTKQEQIYEYNKKLESYNKRALKGTEVVSLLNLVKDTNQNNTEKSLNTGSTRESGNNGNEYPVIDVYLAYLELTNDGKYSANTFRKASYYNEGTGFIVNGTENKNGINYGKYNLELVENKDGKINKDVRDAFKLLYFQCDEIVYDENGYVENIYLRQIYDTRKN